MGARFSAQPPTGRGTADAVVMSAALARRVAQVLRIAQLDGGILTDTGGRTWTFLTTRIDGTRPELLADLDRIGVWVVVDGVARLGPAAAEPGDTWWWIHTPHDGYHGLPPWQAVLATVWRVAGEAPGNDEALAA